MQIVKPLDGWNDLELTLLAVGGADESAVREFEDGTLGSATNPETSSVGLVLESSWWNNLNLPIPLGSRYSEHMINTSGATD